MMLVVLITSTSTRLYHHHLDSDLRCCHRHEAKCHLCHLRPLYHTYTHVDAGVVIPTTTLIRVINIICSFFITIIMDIAANIITAIITIVMDIAVIITTIIVGMPVFIISPKP